MTPEQRKKLEEDALFYLDKVAMAAARTTTAKRAYEDAVHEERVVTEQARELVKKLGREWQQACKDGAQK